MKIRVGLAHGAGDDPFRFAEIVDRLESAAVDSLWLSEIVYGDAVEPVVGMAHALARTSHLKVGTGVMVLPGRQPVLVAKQLMSLAALAPGRVLPAFGLQPARPRERDLFWVPPGRRGAVFDESLEVIRRLVAGEPVTFDGEFFQLKDAYVGPPPGKPLDIWLGGAKPAGLDRVGRLGDGWLASFVTPGEAAAARQVIQHAAARAGREIDPEHFGISLAVSFGELPPQLVAALAARRPDLDPAALIPRGWAAARQLMAEYVDAGLSKFVLRSAAVRPGPAETERFIQEFVQEIMPMQT